MRPTVILVGFFLLGVVSPARAQVVRGTLLEEETSRPIPGAFVILQDSAGRSVATTMTAGAGTWLLRAPAAGTYQIRADRIGYSSLVSEPLTLAEGESVTYRLSAGVAPIEMAELAVEGAGGECDVLEEEGLAVYRVWEEARKALAAIVWTGQQPYYRFDAVHFEQSLDADEQPLSEIEYEEVRYFGRHPFRAIPVQDLVLGGFVQRISGTVQYYGPDAAVLLSDEFLRRHCFRLLDTDDPTLVGLEFEPVADARVEDIAGTMWLDAASAELRRLDFRYENLDLGVDTRHLGGTIHFVRLPSGAWIVQHWAIRVPVLQLGPERRNSAGRPLPRRLILGGMNEGGGQVTAVFLTSRLAGASSTDTLPVRPPPDSLIVRYPLRQ